MKTCILLTADDRPLTVDGKPVYLVKMQPDRWEFTTDVDQAGDYTDQAEGAADWLMRSLDVEWLTVGDDGRVIPFEDEGEE